MMTQLIRTSLLALGVSLVAACAQFDSQRGVEVNWHANVTDTLVKGQSTRSEVLALLGPPSQVIALNDESALYYLFERSEGEGLVLIVYNRMRIDTRYDRAIFFFDESDVLSDFSTHINAVNEG